jgi:hypothetical protein
MQGVGSIERLGTPKRPTGIVSHDPRKIFSPRQESVIGRNQASELAASQPQRAFDLATTIPDGWYRAQAMARIAATAPEPLSDTAFRQARAAAAAGDDAYQRAAVLAAVIAAALKRGRRDLAGAMLADALVLAPAVEPMASRATALHALWSVALDLGDRGMREAVLGSVTAHVHPERSWRARALYRDIVATLAWDRPDHAAALIRAMPEGKTRRYIERRRAEGERKRPRFRD